VRFDLGSSREDDPPVSSDVRPRAISGGTLLLEPIELGGRVLASDPDRDRLWIADFAVRDRIATLLFQPGDEPGRLAWGEDTTVYVVLRGGAVAAVDSDLVQIRWRTPICRSPRGVAWDNDASRVLVACQDGVMAALDRDGSVLARVQLEPDLRDVIVTPDGILVTRFRSAVILRLDADLHVTDRITLAERTDGMDAEGQPRAEPATTAWRMRLGPDGQPWLLHQRRTV